MSNYDSIAPAGFSRTASGSQGVCFTSMFSAQPSGKYQKASVVHKVLEGCKVVHVVQKQLSPHLARLLPRNLRGKNQPRKVKRRRKKENFIWDDDEVEFHLNCVLDFKTQCKADS